VRRVRSFLRHVVGVMDLRSDGVYIQCPSCKKSAAGADGVGYGEGIPLPSRLEGLGERRELPQRGSWRSPGRKRICSIF